MPEAIIQYAVNSTLGTEDFQPLDKIIMAQTRIVASDEVYENLNDVRLDASKDDGRLYLTYPKQFKMSRQGTFRISGKMTRSSASYSDAHLRIYKNGNSVFELSGSYENHPAAQEFATDISFNIGDIISFELDLFTKISGHRDVTLSNFKFSGTVKNNIYEVIE